MSDLSLLDARRSTPARLLAEPGPSDAELLRMLESAVRVPDHGKLVPWRFVRIRGDARTRLGEVLAARRRELEPDAADAVIDKDRARFSFAPLVVTVVGRIAHGHRIPEQEQILSGGCVCFSLLLAAQAMGYGAQWLTGWAAYDAAVGRALGLAEDEHVLGFIHIGTAAEGAPERPRPDPRTLLDDWIG